MKVAPFAFALAVVLSVAAAERPASRAFKGIELYSWQDAQGSWVFAIVPGTNRRKSEAEVKRSENQIRDLSALERRFGELAKGEQVYWFDSDTSGFTFPDAKARAEVLLAAKRAQIELHLPPQPDAKKG